MSLEASPGVDSFWRTGSLVKSEIDFKDRSCACDITDSSEIVPVVCIRAEGQRSCDGIQVP